MLCYEKYFTESEQVKLSVENSFLFSFLFLFLFPFSLHVLFDPILVPFQLLSLKKSLGVFLLPSAFLALEDSPDLLNSFPLFLITSLPFATQYFSA